jgi:predicted permease
MAGLHYLALCREKLFIGIPLSFLTLPAWWWLLQGV